uniref:Myosin-2 essential light chain n=1 Tax=Anopheles merus TaxID=30066 RepID=A0A182UP82_ANOME
MIYTGRNDWAKFYGYKTDEEAQLPQAIRFAKQLNLPNAKVVKLSGLTKTDEYELKDHHVIRSADEIFCLIIFQARYFKEQDIDEFRECFYLFARSGHITTLDELTVIMRSLGLSPTIQELTQYLKKKNGRMSFADFLEVMHQHSRVENLPDEVIQAFKAGDKTGRGTIPARQLRHLLQNWGEGLSFREVDNIFREANVSSNGHVRYTDFVRVACAPVPDYY